MVGFFNLIGGFINLQYDQKKQILFPKNKLPKNIKVGDNIEIVGKSGQVRAYKVIQLFENMVSLDSGEPVLVKI